MRLRSRVVLLAIAVLAGACAPGGEGPSASVPSSSPTSAASAPSLAPSSPSPESPSSPPASAGAPSREPSPSSGLELQVGIALPGGARSEADAELLRAVMDDLGYAVSVEHAEDPAAQAAQLGAMIDGGANVLVVTAVDPASLGDVLARAGSAGIPVLAYDVLPRDTANVAAYLGFDRIRVGRLLGTSVEQALDLKGGGRRRLELIAGAPDDHQRDILAGAMSVLQPYLDNRFVVVPSRRTELDEIATQPADAATARQVVASLLAARPDTRLDIVLSTADPLSQGGIQALRGAGYYTRSQPGPVVTGVGADLESVRSILAGEQTSTVFLDPRALAQQAGRMVTQLLAGTPVDVGDPGSIDNGAGLVPAFLQDSVLITPDNVMEELVESGFYTLQEVQP